MSSEPATKKARPDPSETNAVKSYPLSAVSKALQAISTCSEFAVGGPTNHLPIPGLSIKDYGFVGLPLNTKAAKDLAASPYAKLAPYGKGQETKVDKTVRSTWQFEPEVVDIGNKEKWEKGIGKLVGEVGEVLGVGGDKIVKAKLYKVLLYEEGMFFKVHRDTEKADGMFATLVIQLPSVFKGGELVVRHEGVEKKFVQDQESGSGWSIFYTANYADCEHELLPMKEGCRLAVVYSLCWEGKGNAPMPPKDVVKIENVANAINEWAKSDHLVKYSCYYQNLRRVFKKKIFLKRLEHMYTDASISRSGTGALKGNDAVIANALKQINKDGKYMLLIAQVSKFVEIGAEYEDQPFDYMSAGHQKLAKVFSIDGEELDLVSLDLLRGPQSMVDYADSEDVELADSDCGSEKAYYNFGNDNLDIRKEKKRNLQFFGEPETHCLGLTGNEGYKIEYTYERYALMLCPADTDFYAGMINSSEY